MVVIIRADATEEQLRAIAARAVSLGLAHHLSRGAERAVLLISGGDAAQVEHEFAALPGVDRVLPLTRPYRLSGREVNPRDTVIHVEGQLIGGDSPVMIAGPASFAADPDAIDTATALKNAGADIVRTGVYRSADTLFGIPQLDPQALLRLDAVRRESGLPVATEVLAAEDVPAIARHADLLIVRGEQMHSRPLLQACGWSNRPVLMIRSQSAQVQEFLQAADILLAAGNHQVVLCEQGIRTYDASARHTLDISAVPLIRRVSHLPIVVGPAPGSGQSFMVEPLALAAIAAGANGLVIEAHRPGAPVSPEGEWALDFESFGRLTAQVKLLVAALRNTRGPV